MTTPNAIAASCVPGSHDWQYEITLTPPVSGSHLGGHNITVYRCAICSHSWDGATARYWDGTTAELIYRTSTPQEAVNSIIDHYTGESIPGVKDVAARNRRLRRRLRSRI